MAFAFPWLRVLALSPLLVSLSCRKTVHIDKQTGVFELPAGVTEITSPIEVPAGAHDLEIRGAATGSTMRAATGFRGSAMLVIRGAKTVKLTGFALDGNRTALAKPVELPPSDITFARFYTNNGILALDTEGLTMEALQITEVANYSILVSASKDVHIRKVRVRNGGSLNPKGHNNASGGILLEEGCAQFDVLDSDIENVRGNAIWTHSLYKSPRNQDGRFAGNRIRRVARDALQAGHAIRMRIENNSGSEIGYPAAEVDLSTGAVPVVLDTAGNVEGSLYANNRFEEINGKCIDLDGFHAGEVRDNVCVNRKAVSWYPHGHFGIVFNNSNPDMRSESVIVTGNRMEGFRFGGLFLIGTNHTIRNNQFLRINQAHCNETATTVGCLYKADEPDLLQSGIYLGAGAHRPAPARHNLVADNKVTGWKMKQRCVAFAPGVSRKDNDLTGNVCEDE